MFPPAKRRRMVYKEKGRYRLRTRKKQRVSGWIVLVVLEEKKGRKCMRGGGEGGSRRERGKGERPLPGPRR